MARNIASTTSTKDGDKSTIAYVVSCSLGDLGNLVMTIGGKAFTAIVTTGGIITKFPEYDFRFELVDSR